VKSRVVHIEDHLLLLVVLGYMPAGQWLQPAAEWPANGVPSKNSQPLNTTKSLTNPKRVSGSDHVNFDNVDDEVENDEKADGKGTYYLFGLFNTSFDLWDMCTSLIVKGKFDILFPDNGQILLDREFPLTKSLASNPLRSHSL
jgi:hypothetical protein